MRKIKILDTCDDMDFLNGLTAYATINHAGMFTAYFLRGVAPNGMQKTLLLRPTVEDLGRASVKAATEIMYREMPKTFSGYDLWKRVSSILEREMYADTVFRRMRELKAEGVVNFVCLNDKESLYEKR